MKQILKDKIKKSSWETNKGDRKASSKIQPLTQDRNTSQKTNPKVSIDAIKTINEYLERQDWRVNANANQGYSLGGLILNISGKMTANYWLSHLYPQEIGEVHRGGDLHIHDLDMLAGYCAGWSLRTLLAEGFNGVSGKVEAGPPKHFSSAIGQIVNFLGTLQNEWAGAQAFSSFDTYMSPYVRKEKLKYVQVKQKMQELIFNLNVPSRWGTQTPFTNLTFDWVCPEDLCAQYPVIAGKKMGTLQPLSTISSSFEVIKPDNASENAQAVRILEKINSLISEMEKYLNYDSVPNVQVLMKELFNEMEQFDSLQANDFSPKILKAFDQVTDLYFGVLTPCFNNYVKHPNVPENKSRLMGFLKEFDGTVDIALDAL